MSAAAKSYVITPPTQAAIAVAGTDKMFPVRRIWCVGRNYEEHIREMGHDVRDPPFFFSKPADAIVADGASVPYPPLTKDIASRGGAGGGAQVRRPQHPARSG
jgi:fumarylpyruvate hydrolase